MVADEEKALIAKIIASNDFGQTDGQDELLWFLYEHRHKPLRAKEIEIAHYKRAANARDHNPGHSRERIFDLRRRLKDVQDRWAINEVKVEIEQRGAGYQLAFRKGEQSQSATEAFWRPY